MRSIIVKEGPLVFLRDIVIMEIVAMVFLYVISLLGHYELLFHDWSLDHYIRYDVFILIISSLFQLFYLIIIFLSWYFAFYEISTKEITKKSGLIFRRRKSVSLADVVSIELYQSPISRMMKHATIILEHRGGRVTKIKNVSNFAEYIHIIKQNASSISGRSFDRDIASLLKHGESANLEFKQTLRYNAKNGETSKELERVIVKSIVGFLNAEGGTLLIGVNDDGKVTGLKNDYKTLSKKNRDGMENHITLLIRDMIGLPFAKYVDIAFEEVDGEDVCIVTVKSSHKPAYLKNVNGDKREEFFVRIGNSTQPFSMSEAEEYIKTRFV